jgi:CRP-like cAMP-binding protein
MTTLEASHAQTLLEFAHAIQRLAPEAANDFVAIWQHQECGRKEILTSPDEQEKYLYFILDGVQRVFYLDEQNREATLVFTYAPSFGGVLDSLLLKQASKYYYETLTKSTYLRAPIHLLEQVMQQHYCIEVMVRKGVTAATAGLLTRLVELQCFTSEDKYKNLLKRSPHILQLVPHKYIANYLGMDATNFSKLINKIRIDE